MRVFHFAPSSSENVVDNDGRHLEVVQKFRAPLVLQVGVAVVGLGLLLADLHDQILGVLAVGRQPPDVVRLPVAAARFRAPRPVALLAKFLAAFLVEQPLAAGVPLLASLEKNTDPLQYVLLNAS